MSWNIGISAQDRPSQETNGIRVTNAFNTVAISFIMDDPIRKL